MQTMSKLNELVSSVEQWSIDKGLDKADSSKQFLKVSEEVGEVAAALVRNDMDALRDGIGDVIVTAIILAQQNNMTLEECLNQAYGEIKNRTGKTINGTFIKSEDFDKMSILNQDVVKGEIERIRNVEKDFDNRNVEHDISIFKEAITQIDKLVTGENMTVLINGDMWDECHKSLDTVMDFYKIKLVDGSVSYGNFELEKVK